MPVEDNDYKYTYTTEIVCPHCLYEYSDSWEYGKDFDRDSTIELECPRCGQKFDVTRDITVDYTSTKKETV